MAVSERAITKGSNQLFGTVFGAVYLLVGLVGFAVTSGVGFAEETGKNLIVFGLNPLHNIVHLGVGALLLGASRGGEHLSRQANLLVGGVYLAVGLIGFALIGSGANIIALNLADNFLHLATATVALGVGLGKLAIPVRA